jgi:hypothetical protein
MMQGNWGVDGMTRGGGYNAQGWLSRWAHNNQQTMVAERGGRWQGDGQEQRASMLAVARSGPLAVGEDGWRGMIGITLDYQDIAQDCQCVHDITQDCQCVHNNAQDCRCVCNITDLNILKGFHHRKVLWKFLFKRCGTFI